MRWTACSFGGKDIAILGTTGATAAVVGTTTTTKDGIQIGGTKTRCVVAWVRLVIAVGLNQTGDCVVTRTVLRPHVGTAVAPAFIPSCITTLCARTSGRTRSGVAGCVCGCGRWWWWRVAVALL